MILMMIQPYNKKYSAANLSEKVFVCVHNSPPSAICTQTTTSAQSQCFRFAENKRLHAFQLTDHFLSQPLKTLSTELWNCRQSRKQGEHLFSKWSLSPDQTKWWSWQLWGWKKKKEKNIQAIYVITRRIKGNIIRWYRHDHVFHFFYFAFLHKEKNISLICRQKNKEPLCTYSTCPKLFVLGHTLLHQPL